MKIRTTMYIEEELLNKLKIKAIELKYSGVSELLSEIAEEFINENAEIKAPSIRNINDTINI